jgi:type IV secretion system protein VirB1
MTALAFAAAIALAQSCTVPDVPAENVLAVARQESGLMPWALHDDDARQGFRPTSAEQAISLAKRLMAQGHSVGVGLMQLTARSEAAFRTKFGVTVEDALNDPCQNIHAGAALLAANYHAAASASRKAALAALQTYNSGSPTGAPDYAAAVVRIAARMPSLAPAQPPRAPAAAEPPPAPSPAPPRWDLFGRARGGAQSILHVAN